MRTHQIFGLAEYGLVHRLNVEIIQLIEKTFACFLHLRIIHFSASQSSKQRAEELYAHQIENPNVIILPLNHFYCTIGPLFFVE